MFDHDEGFVHEQAHLSRTYAELERLRTLLSKKLASIAVDAAKDKDSMAHELTYNGTSFDEMQIGRAHV